LFIIVNKITLIVLINGSLIERVIMRERVQRFIAIFDNGSQTWSKLKTGYLASSRKYHVADQHDTVTQSLYADTGPICPALTLKW